MANFIALKFIALTLTVLLSNWAWSADKNLPESQDAGPDIGISIIGDQESPTVLHLVPWQSPKNPDIMPLEIPPIDSLNPIDRDSLRREISYFYRLQNKGEKNDNASPP